MKYNKKRKDDIDIISVVVKHQQEDCKKIALEMYNLQDKYTFTLSEDRKKFHKRIDELREEYEITNDDLDKSKKSLNKLKQRKRRLDELSNLPPRKRKPVNYKEVTERQIKWGIITRSISGNTHR